VEVFEHHNERNTMRSVIIGVLVVIGCTGAMTPGAEPKAATSQPGEARLAASPIVRIRREDYAEARGKFATKIVREMGGFPKEALGPVPPDAEEVEYASRELRLKGWINKSDSGRKPGEKKPAVLFLHGGFRLEDNAWEATQPYRDAGFIVFTPTLRAENRQPGTFTLFYDEVDDVLAAGKFLREQKGVDPQRVFIAGHSAGGILTMLAVEASKDFRAAAAMSGSPDQLMLAKTVKVPVPFDENDPRELEMRSPLAYVSSVKCPLRIYYGSEEEIFDQSSRRMAELGKKDALDVEAAKVPGNHKSSVPEAVRRSLVFFQGKL
jgi:hypothetical protein